MSYLKTLRYNKRDVGIIICMVIMLSLSVHGCKRKESVTLKDKTILRFGTFESTPEQQKLNHQIITRFEERHLDIKVKMELTKPDKILVEIAGGSGPDVFYYVEGRLPPLVKKGVVLDMMPYIKRDGILLKEAYYHKSVESFQYDDRLYAFPLHFSTFALIYNKGIFDKEGIKFPDDTWGWDGYLEAARKLTIDRNGDNKIDQFGCNRPPWGIMIESFGGRVFNETFTQCEINSPQAIEALTLTVDLDKKYRVIPTEAMQKEMGETFGELSGFMTGRVAMYCGMTWMVSALKTVKDFEWDVASLPKSMAGRVNWMGSGGLCISNNTSHRDEVWEFVKFYCGEIGSNLLAENKNCVPAYKKAAEEVFTIPPPQYLKVFIEAVRYSSQSPKSTDFEEVNSRFVNPVIELIFLGEMTPTQGIEKIASSCNRYFAKGD